MTPLRRKIVAGTALAGSACALVALATGIFRPAAVSASRPIVIKFSHVVADETPKGAAALYFKRLVEERTQRGVLVQVYPNSELYKDKEELEALQLGSVQMVAPSLAKLGPLGIGEFELFDLPFLFDGYASLHRVTDGPVGRQLMARLDEVGLLGLAFWDNGFKEMSADRPLVVPADFRGLRMRIQSSEVLDAQMRALGAIPDAMALSDVYAALASGVVNGTENVASNFLTQKMYEVQAFLTLSDHGYLGYVVVVNQTFWNQLPGSVRSVLDEAMKDATRFANDIAKSENDAALDRVRKEGKTQIIELSPQQREAWRAALSSVHEGFQRRVGKRLLEDAYRAIGSGRTEARRS